MKYLIDTSVISELIHAAPDPRVTAWFAAVPNEDLYLSVLTLGEMRKSVVQVEDLVKKEKLRIWLERELPAWFDQRILDIDVGVVERWGRLLAEYKKLPSAIDALIVATALHLDMCLVTRHAADFDCYPELLVVDPWDVYL